MLCKELENWCLLQKSGMEGPWTLPLPVCCRCFWAKRPVFRLPSGIYQGLQGGVEAGDYYRDSRFVRENYRKKRLDFTIQDIEQVFQLFKGEIQQIPPMYSAVKQKGKKLYQYAREGKKVEREPRKVFIHSIKLLEFYPPSRILFEVKCSKGTYIRTLCVQIGDFLECGGHMSFLLRKQVGLFSLQEAHTMEQLLDSPSRNKIKEFLLPLDYIFQGSEKLFLHEAEVHDLQQGRYLAYTKLLEKYGEDIPEPVDETVVPVYTKKSVFTLLARWKKEEESMFYLKPEKVLQSS